MRRPIACRAALLLALLLLVVATPGGAATRVSARSQGGGGVWSRAVAAWVGIWEKIGCGADPDGLRGALSEEKTGDIGCGGDPNGHCRFGTDTMQPSAEIGCVIDPDGKCRAH